jgi:hypothetical protein
MVELRQYQYRDEGLLHWIIHGKTDASNQRSITKHIKTVLEMRKV